MEGRFLSELMTSPDLILPGKLNVIEAGVSTGKTTFALHTLPKWANTPENILYLIDTNAGEQYLLNDPNMISRFQYSMDEYGRPLTWGESFFQTKDRSPVMTYAGFGSEVIKSSVPFWEKYEYIVCDELSSMVIYQDIPSDHTYLEEAEKTLGKIIRAGKTKVIALSATPKKIKDRFDDLWHRVDIDYAALRKFQTAQTLPYKNIDDLLPRCRGKCGIVYIQTVGQMKEFMEKANAIGLRANGFWSIHNKDCPMDSSQIALRDTVIKGETIPPDLDILVINRAAETCFKIKPENRHVDFIIVHNSDEDIQTQVRGRYCGNLDVLYLHDSKDKTVYPSAESIPASFLGIKLFADKKDELRELLSPDAGKTISSQRAVEMVAAMGYEIKKGRSGNNHYWVITEKKRQN